MQLTQNQKVAIYASALEGIMTMAAHVKPEALADRAIEVGKEMIKRMEQLEPGNPNAPIED